MRSDTANWRVRPFEPGDEAGVCRLLERGFGRRFDEITWRWKLKRRPAPMENVWLAVDREDRPIFHYGAIPRRVEIEGAIRDVVVAVDSTTDPEFRRQGVLTAAVGAAHQTWTDAGIACVLGLPNEQWGSRVQKLDWRPLFPMSWLIRPLRPERILARRLGLPVLGRLGLVGRLWRALTRRRPIPGLEIRNAAPGESEVTTLTAAPAKEHLMLDRDRKWLDWRYFECPGKSYRMLTARRPEAPDAFAGYLAYRFDAASRYGFIAELLTRPADRDARRALIAAAVDRLDRLGAIAVATLAVPGSVLYRAWRHGRFFPNGKSFTVHCVPLTEDLPLDMLGDPRRWWLHGGDFDVI